MLQLGVHPKVAAERLGHDVMTLMQTYSHVLPSMHKEVARLLSKAARA
jgi:site-specific recombinase XerD